jgi:hypothetical protein
MRALSHAPAVHGTPRFARRRSPFLRCSDDGLDRVFRIFNALRGRVCRICTRLFAFSFAFVPVRDHACTRWVTIGRYASVELGPFADR